MTPAVYEWLEFAHSAAGSEIYIVAISYNKVPSIKALYVACTVQQCIKA